MNGDKITTIQVNDRTLYLLKRLKMEMKANSYDEVIQRKMNKPMKSMAGSLKKYFKNYSTEKMLKEIKEERREFDRF